MPKKIQVKIPIKNPIERGQVSLCYISALVYFSTTSDLAIMEENGGEDGFASQIELMRDLMSALILECGGCFDELERAEVKNANSD